MAEPTTTFSSPFPVPTSPSPTSSETPTSAPTPSPVPTESPTETTPPTTQPSSTEPETSASTTSSEATPSESSSSETPSSTSSTAPTSSSSETPSTSASSTVSPIPTPTSSPRSISPTPTVIESTSGTEVVIITVSATPSPTADANQQNDTTSKSFFDNKGAVAGVFTVVGLVVLVILFAIITNAIRRRRAKKFDRDVAEAAAHAAATAHAPNFDDDDREFAAHDPQGAQSIYTGYSGESHGTYAQPPMAVPESYNMSEIRSFDPYTNAGVGSGAAGIGAAGLGRSRSTTAPYGAFAGPTNDPYAPMPGRPAQSQTMYDVPQTPGQNLRYRPRSIGNHYDLADAAGIGAGAAAAAGAANLARGPSQQYSSSPSSLSRNKSLGAQTLGSSSGEHESYAAHYQPGFNSDVYQPPPVQTQAQTQQYLNAPPRPLSTGPSDLYGGIDASPPPSAELPNPHSPVPPTHPSDHRPLSGNYSSPDGSDPDDSGSGGYGHQATDSRASLREDDDYAYGGGRRVLKVANE